MRCWLRRMRGGIGCLVSFSVWIVDEKGGVLMGIAQMSDWEERDQSWKRFRAELDGGKKRGKLGRRLSVW